MNVLEVMRQIMSKIGNDAVIKLEIGDYKSGQLKFLKDNQSRLVIVKDGAFLTWVIDDDELINPSALIEQIVNEAPQMIEKHNYYLEHPDEIMAELVKKVNKR